MENQDDIFYQAYLARDHRFDGKFFCGVKTTGIYCRPICPAKPKRQNIEFFPDSFMAEKAGYRPCLRCRPECAPYSGGWLGKSATVKRALSLIDSKVLVEKNENQFADLLGVSARHLRRLFDEELGKTPKQIFDTNRLNFARKLIVETKLPITEIALTSGFSSIRRFNEAFKARFHRAPSELRNSKLRVDDSNYYLTLSYRPPYDFKSLLTFYEAHLVPGIESVEKGSYTRVFKLDETVGALTLSINPKDHELILKVSTTEPKSLYMIVQKVRQMFDVDSDPLLLTGVFSRCPLMSKLNKKYPGLRLPRGWDAFETSICAILGQLVSVKQAQSLVKQLVETYGEKVTHPITGLDAYLFPAPEALAQASLQKVRTTEARRETIRQFSKLVIRDRLKLSAAQDPSTFRKTILNVRGIGPWTAEYICLRALGDTNAFPATDLILKRVIKKFPKLKLEKLKPWRGYVAFYLWREFARKTK